MQINSDIINIPHPRSYISKEDAVILICGRASKIHNAIMYVSSFIKDRNSIKDSIRNTSIAVLTAANKTLQGGNSGYECMAEHLNNILSETSLLDALVESCGFGRQIPHSTTVLLQKEIRLLAQAVALLRDLVDGDKNITFPDLKKMIGMEMMPDVTLKNKVERKVGKVREQSTLAAPEEVPSKDSKGVYWTSHLHTKDIDAEGKKEVIKAASTGASTAEIQNDKGHAFSMHEMEGGVIKSQKSEKAVLPNGTNTDTENRQAIIKNVIQSKGKVSVSDILPFVQGCSEKTIQRDLLKMVSLGLLKKEGERRWSRYSLSEYES